MILKDIIEKQVTEYQIAVARSILSFNNVKDLETREALLDSYREIVERADDQEEIRQRAFDSKGEDNSIDEILDDPRRGQSVFINNKDY
jgi:hypothetical protein